MRAAARNVSCSGQNLANHFAVNIGKAAIDSIVAKDEFLVIDPQQMQDRGLKIMALISTREVGIKVVRWEDIFRHG